MSNSLWYGFWDQWNLFHKVTFDGENKLIIIAYGVTDIDIQVDVYSDWKEWSRIDNNLRFEAALRAVGGDPTVGSSFLGDTYFLINGWRMRTWEGAHTLEVDGNFFVDGGGSTFVNTIRPWTTQINVLRSNLVDVIVVSGSSQVITSSFSEVDRAILNGIDDIVQNLPNSGSLTDIQTGIDTIQSAVVMVGGVVTSGGMNAVETTLVQPTAMFDNMFVAISSGSVRVVRKVDEYLSTNGKITFDVPLPFSAISGSSGVTVLPEYNPTNGSVG